VESEPSTPEVEQTTGAPAETLEPLAPLEASPVATDEDQATPDLKPKAKHQLGHWLRGLHKHPTVGLFVTIALVLTVMTAIIVLILFIAGYPVVGTLLKPSTSTNNQSLSKEQLDQLSKTSATLGGAGQTLVVGANARFSSDVAADKNVNVAGTLNVSGATTLNNLKVNGSFEPANLNISNNLIVAGTATLQRSVSISDFLNVGGALTVTGNASIGGNLTVGNLTARNTSLNGPLTLNGHIITSGTAPAVAAGSVGSGGTVSISGNDQAGTVVISTGGGPASGTLATITFRSPYSTVPHVIISPVGSGSGGLNYYVTRTSTGFVIGTTNAPGASSTFTFDYFVAQ
jgi:hypothetical protein